MILLGAIMFNDVLTFDECSDLLRQLSKCAFPFQCAHGRPSMIPLLDMELWNKPSPRFEEQFETGLAKGLKRFVAVGFDS
jgi:DNA mismatch repair ATPase MutL